MWRCTVHCATLNSSLQSLITSLIVKCELIVYFSVHCWGRWKIQQISFQKMRSTSTLMESNKERFLASLFSCVACCSISRTLTFHNRLQRFLPLCRTTCHHDRHHHYRISCGLSRHSLADRVWHWERTGHMDWSPRIVPWIHRPSRCWKRIGKLPSCINSFMLLLF